MPPRSADVTGVGGTAPIAVVIAVISPPFRGVAMSIPRLVHVNEALSRFGGLPHLTSKVASASPLCTATSAKVITRIIGTTTGTINRLLQDVFVVFVFVVKATISTRRLWR